MKRDPFLDRLRQLPVPPPDPAAKARALHRAQAALGRPETSASTPAPAFGRIGFALLSAACLVVLSWIGLAEHRRTEEEATLRVVLGQMEETFQNRLAAVVLTGGGAQVVLSGDDAGTAGTAKPILFTLRDARGTTRILTFSGRSIDLPVNGTAIRVQVMETGGGRLFVAGDRFVWDGSRRAVGGTRMEGRFL